MRIAIVDDDPKLCAKLQAIILGMTLPGGTPPEIELLGDGDQLLKRYRHSREPYDMLLLDYDMPVINGFEAAQEIRRRYDQQVVILVITKYKGKAYEASRFQPYLYCWKPELTVAGLQADFLAAYEEALKRQRESIVLLYKGAGRRIHYRDIYYIEKPKGGPLQCYTALREEPYADSRSLTKMIELLQAQKNNHFHHVYRPYLVNLENVVEVNAREQYLDIKNGVRLRISPAEAYKTLRRWLKVYRK